MQEADVLKGFDGLIKVGKLRPDLLITDLMMPGMDGFQMIEAIRNTKGLEELQIVVVTGLDKESIAAKGIPDGEVHIVHKPVPFDEIKQIVEEKLSEHGIQREGLRLVTL